ncbi:hypothetical protein CLOM_g5135 [Closterium sp. NIES-68]|nr:hypothetical protein CLOM_g5135 [Closterium sp. NIES-68]GJP79621.1 hypothetical protein CLOP_g9830 [Closterium sp. NIES-67]
MREATMGVGRGMGVGESTRWVRLDERASGEGSQHRQRWPTSQRPFFFPEPTSTPLLGWFPAAECEKRNAR